MSEAAISALAQQMAAITAQLTQMAGENATLRQQMAEETAARTAREQTFRAEVETAAATSAAAQAAAVAEATRRAQEATTAASAGGASSAEPSYSGQGTSVAKWAPDGFKGQQSEWKTFSLKFRSYCGAFLRGTVGTWMDYAVANRDGDCRMAALDPAARPAAAMLWSSLIATCDNTALVLCERAGAGEGIEAWRRLNVKYDVQTRQTKVVRIIKILNWDFKSGDLLDQLDAFDTAIAKYESATGKELDDDTKIGVVIKGMESGSLQEHMLLHSERCVTYEEFREEVDTIAKAKQSNLLSSSPMDIGVLKGGGSKGGGSSKGPCHNCGKPGHYKSECCAPGGGAASSGGGKAGGKPGGKHGGGSHKGGGSTKGPCHNCGKNGHVKSECRAPGGGAAKGASKGGGPTSQGGNCNKCGMAGHWAKECRSSAARQAAFKKKSQGVHEIDEDIDPGLGFMCDLCGPAVDLQRSDGTDRKITFKVDSGACTTVVHPEHRAVRGYKIWKDEKTGKFYRTAGTAQVKDEGKRILQTKMRSGPDGKPVRLRTRAARSTAPLMAVKDMVAAGQMVVFDAEGSFTYDKASGKKTPFHSTAGGWELTLDLEAPETANKVNQQVIAEIAAEKETEKADGGDETNECVKIFKRNDKPIIQMGPFGRQLQQRA